MPARTTMDQAVLARRMASLADLCRRAGLRATHQRTEIFRELARTTEHPDVESVYRKVRRRIPQISLDTVYRTLRLLEARGLVFKISYPGDRARFDANVGPHHHFICNRCGRVYDFCSDKLDRFRAPRGAAALGAIESVRMELRGVCRACGRRASG